MINSAASNESPQIPSFQRWWPPCGPQHELCNNFGLHPLFKLVPCRNMLPPPPPIPTWCQCQHWTFTILRPLPPQFSVSQPQKPSLSITDTLGPPVTQAFPCCHWSHARVPWTITVLCVPSRKTTTYTHSELQYPECQAQSQSPMWIC